MNVQAPECGKSKRVLFNCPFCGYWESSRGSVMHVRKAVSRRSRSEQRYSTAIAAAVFIKGIGGNENCLSVVCDGAIYTVSYLHISVL